MTRIKYHTENSQILGTTVHPWFAGYRNQTECYEISCYKRMSPFLHASFLDYQQRRWRVHCITQFEPPASCSQMTAGNSQGTMSASLARHVPAKFRKSRRSCSEAEMTERGHARPNKQHDLKTFPPPPLRRQFGSNYI